MNPKMKYSEKGDEPASFAGRLYYENADGEIIYIGKAKALKNRRQPVFRLAKSPSDKST